MLPICYGKWQAVYRQFIRWRDKGIWNNLFKKASGGADLTEVMCDGTIVRSHACSAGYGKDSRNEQALGRSKGGFTTKIHALVDGLGNPLRFVLTGGHRHDINKAEELIVGIKGANVIADKVYDSDRFREKIVEQNCTHTTPPRRNR